MTTKFVIIRAPALHHFGNSREPAARYSARGLASSRGSCFGTVRGTTSNDANPRDPLLIDRGALKKSLELRS